MPRSVNRALNFGIGAALVIVVCGGIAVLHVKAIADMEPQTWSITE